MHHLVYSPWHSPWRCMHSSCKVAFNPYCRDEYLHVNDVPVYHLDSVHKPELSKTCSYSTYSPAIRLRIDCKIGFLLWNGPRAPSYKSYAYFDDTPKRFTFGDTRSKYSPESAIKAWSLAELRIPILRPHIAPFHAHVYKVYTSAWSPFFSL